MSQPENNAPAGQGPVDRPVRPPVPKRADSGGHDWRDDGLDTHKGEYWYRCARCGAADWIASYGTQDQLMPRECKPPQQPRLDDDGMPIDGSNPNPPECDPRA